MAKTKKPVSSGMSTGKGAVVTPKPYQPRMSAAKTRSAVGTQIGRRIKLACFARQ